MKFKVLLLVFTYCLSNGQVNNLKINKEVDKFIQEKMVDLKIPGLAIAVIKDGHVIKKSVYGKGNLEWGNNITDHSCFQAASCTKLLTSTLLMKTIFFKKIDLDNSISIYLDSLPNDWKKIKVKNLISHSSGLPELSNSFPYYVTTEEAVKELKKYPLKYEPDTKSEYCQSEFMLLAYIFEKIYEKPFATILREEVTIPLNMKDGSFDMEYKVSSSPLGIGGYMQLQLVNERVSTYYDNNGELLVYKFLYPQYHYSGGGYYASIDDWVNWAIGLDKGLLFPLDFANNLMYGFDKIGNVNSFFSKVGWVVEEEDNILKAGHSGGPGLGDILRFKDERITIIVLTNDGELLPGISRAISSWYVKGLSKKYHVEKFDR